MKFIVILLLFSSCSPLTKYNRQIKSLDKYIEHNYQKEQKQLKREFKRQQP
tara:strand:- start:36083 stop:36235 length:153 start_codon:yes stop_codon:yes gene_type:complete